MAWRVFLVPSRPLIVCKKAISTLEMAFFLAQIKKGGKRLANGAVLLVGGPVIQTLLQLGRIVLEREDN